MPVCPRQCHFGCVLVGIEHDVHEREARVALDAVACTHSLSKECHCRPTVTVSPMVQKVLRWILVKGLLPAAAIMCLVAAKRAASAQRSELCCIGDTDGCLCVWFALLVVWLVVYAPGTPMCLRVGFIISW